MQCGASQYSIECSRVKYSAVQYTCVQVLRNVWGIAVKMALDREAPWYAGHTVIGQDTFEAKENMFHKRY